jgi:ABC transporter substrate binding protein/Phage integrase family
MAAARKSSRYGHRDATMILIGYRHGLRASELCDLQWSQVEMATGRLHVRRVKNGSPSVHPMQGDEIRALRRLAAGGQIGNTGDPVKDDLVRSLNRPGSNVTGVSFLAGLLGAKRLELLHQIVPKATAIGVLVNPDAPDTEAERRDVQAAARAIGQQLIILDVKSDSDIEAAFATFVQRGAGALLAGTGAFMNSHRQQLVALAARHALPAIYSLREPVADGGLMSYAPSITDAYRQTGIYTARPASTPGGFLRARSRPTFR